MITEWFLFSARKAENGEVKLIELKLSRFFYTSLEINNQTKFDHIKTCVGTSLKTGLHEGLTQYPLCFNNASPLRQNTIDFVLN